MEAFKRILLYLLLISFITKTNSKLFCILLPLLILSLTIDRISKKYYILLLGVLALIMQIFNLYKNSKEVFLVIGIIGFLSKKYFVKILKVKDKLTDGSKKNSYQIWGYTIVMSMESIGIYGFLGYNYFLYNESAIGLLKVLFLGVLYNYSQSDFVIKDN